MNSISLKSVRVSDPYAFQNLLQQKSRVLLEELEAWVSAHEVDAVEAGSAGCRQMSVGVYCYENFSGGENHGQN